MAEDVCFDTNVDLSYTVLISVISGINISNAGVITSDGAFFKRAGSVWLETVSSKFESHSRTP